MNINALRDSDNDPGIWVAACAFDPAAAWRGASLFVSIDGGTNYTVAATITNETPLGYTTNALGDFRSGNIVDELNSVNVKLRHGTLSSTTLAGLLTGANACVIGDEILCFRDATLEADGSYTLRGFLRGRRGSEYAMSQHATAERFVLVDFSTLVRVAQDTSAIGLSRLYKAVTSGTPLASATAKSFTNEGTGLKPYAPVQLGGGRDASGNLTLTAVRRSRISGEWRDNVDVPLGEASEAYVVRIYADNTYATVLRTIDGLSSPVATYSAADQTTDFGSPQATVYFDWRQISAIVGPGHAARGSV